MPLDFIYDRKTDTYAIENYRTNDDLVQKIQTGKGDELLMFDGYGNNIWLEVLFGGTTPRKPKQDYIFGDNDLVSAKAFRYENLI